MITRILICLKFGIIVKSGLLIYIANDEDFVSIPRDA